MESLFKLEGRRAAVTGASAGIGRALASGLARAGAEVIGIARRREKLEEWQEEQRQADLSVNILRANLGSPDAIPDVVRELTKSFGAPDILINAAGLPSLNPGGVLLQQLTR